MVEWHRLQSVWFYPRPNSHQSKPKSRSTAHRLKPVLLVRDGYGRAPKQQEQETNITVHRKKRSIHPAEVVRRNQRMLVSEQRGHHGNSYPRGPRQVETPGEPRQQADHHDVHGTGNVESPGDSETL